MNNYLINNTISDGIIKEVVAPLFAENTAVESYLKEFKTWQNQSYYKYLDIAMVSDKFLLQNEENKGAISNVGLDLPTWFGNFDGKDNKKKAILYGINPIRSKGDWSEIGSEKKTVAIGTAWASHQDKFTTTDKKYWPLINKLIEEFDIYLTDIHKIYYLNKDGKQSHKTGFNNIDFHTELINKELEIINPDIVITIGFQAYYLLTGETLNSEKFELKPWGDKTTKIAAFPHLSGSVREPFRKKYLGLNPEIEEYNGNSFFDLLKMSIDTLKKD